MCNLSMYGDRKGLFVCNPYPVKLSSLCVLGDLYETTSDPVTIMVRVAEAAPTFQVSQTFFPGSHVVPGYVTNEEPDVPDEPSESMLPAVIAAATLPMNDSVNVMGEISTGQFSKPILQQLPILQVPYFTELAIEMPAILGVDALFSDWYNNPDNADEDTALEWITWQLPNKRESKHRVVLFGAELDYFEDTSKKT